MHVLEFVGLGGTENNLAKELPLDKQKRLEVARALATKPEILMLDEVMAGLNPAEVGKAMILVKKFVTAG